MNPITEIINKLNELNKVGSICYSDYRELMTLARVAQWGCGIKHSYPSSHKNSYAVNGEKLLHSWGMDGVENTAQ